MVNVNIIINKAGEQLSILYSAFFFIRKELIMI